MVGHRAALSREAAAPAVRSVRLLAGLATPQQGGGLAGAGACRSPDLLIIPHPQGRLSPDITFQNPMF